MRRAKLEEGEMAFVSFEPGWLRTNVPAKFDKVQMIEIGDQMMYFVDESLAYIRVQLNTCVGQINGNFASVQFELKLF